MTTNGLYQPLGRIDPVAPVPSILTSARPLPAAQAAAAFAAAVDALKGGREITPHLADLDLAIDRLGDDDSFATGRVRTAAVRARDALRVAVHDPAARQAGAVADAALSGDELFGLADSTWSTGITWNTLQCERSYVEKRCTSYNGTTSVRSDPTEEGTAVHTEPFTVYSPLSCDWAYHGTRLGDNAAALTEAHTAYAVGQALWLGNGLPVDTSIPTLRRNAVDVTPLAVPTADVGVAILLSEYEQLTFGSGGAVLHVPSILAVGAEGGIPGGGKFATRVADFMRGPLGSIVSFGPGYPHGGSVQSSAGFGPYVSGSADESAGTTSEVYQGNGPSEAWIYVSGPVEWAQAPISVLPEEDVQRRNFGRPNTYEVWAQRMAIVRFDPCAVLACKVTNYAGSAS